MRYKYIYIYVNSAWKEGKEVFSIKRIINYNIKNVLGLSHWEHVPVVKNTERVDLFLDADLFKAALLLVIPELDGVRVAGSKHVKIQCKNLLHYALRAYQRVVLEVVQPPDANFVSAAWRELLLVELGQSTLIWFYSDFAFHLQVGQIPDFN